MNQQQPLTGRTSIRVDTSPEFKARVERAAREDGRTVANFVRHTLVKSLETRRGEDK